MQCAPFRTALSSPFPSPRAALHPLVAQCLTSWRFRRFFVSAFFPCTVSAPASRARPLQDGWTPLIACCHRGNLDAAQVLLKMPNINIGAMDKARPPSPRQSALPLPKTPSPPPLRHPPPPSPPRSALPAPYYPPPPAAAPRLTAARPARGIAQPGGVDRPPPRVHGGEGGGRAGAHGGRGGQLCAGARARPRPRPRPQPPPSLRRALPGPSRPLDPTGDAPSLSPSPSDEKRSSRARLVAGGLRPAPPGGVLQQDRRGARPHRGGH